MLRIGSRKLAGCKSPGKAQSLAHTATKAIIGARIAMLGLLPELVRLSETAKTAGAEAPEAEAEPEADAERELPWIEAERAGVCAADSFDASLEDEIE